LKHGQAVVDYYESNEEQKRIAFNLALCFIHYTLNKNASYRLGFFEKKQSSVDFGYPVVAGRSSDYVNYFESSLRFCESIVKASAPSIGYLHDVVDKQLVLLDGTLPRFEVLKNAYKVACQGLNCI